MADAPGRADHRAHLHEVVRQDAAARHRHPRRLRGVQRELDFNWRTDPQSFEVDDGSLTLMEGSDACGKFDPPYAGSSAAFHTFPLPGIASPKLEPWVGTFGGAGHDHHEEPPVPPGPNQ